MYIDVVIVVAVLRLTPSTPSHLFNQLEEASVENLIDKAIKREHFGKLRDPSQHACQRYDPISVKKGVHVNLATFCTSRRFS
jgi:hypothetical protein